LEQQGYRYDVVTDLPDFAPPGWLLVGCNPSWISTLAIFDLRRI